MTGLERGVSLSGRSAQGAPVLNTHRMPLMTERRLFQGRPRPSDRILGFGISGSRVFHCSSVKSREWHIACWCVVALHGPQKLLPTGIPSWPVAPKNARDCPRRASVVQS